MQHEYGGDRPTPFFRHFSNPPVFLWHTFLILKVNLVWVIDPTIVGLLIESFYSSYPYQNDSVSIILFRYKIVSRDLQVSVVVQIAPWLLALLWTVVVRHTIWFIVAAYFTHVLARNYQSHTPDHVVCKNLIHGLPVELNFPAVMIVRMDYVDLKTTTITE